MEKWSAFHEKFTAWKRTHFFFHSIAKKVENETGERKRERKGENDEASRAARHARASLFAAMHRRQDMRAYAILLSRGRWRRIESGGRTATRSPSERNVRGEERSRRNWKKRKTEVRDTGARHLAALANAWCFAAAKAREAARRRRMSVFFLSFFLSLFFLALSFSPSFYRGPIARSTLSCGVGARLAEHPGGNNDARSFRDTSTRRARLVQMQCWFSMRVNKEACVCWKSETAEEKKNRRETHIRKYTEGEGRESRYIRD